MMQYRNRKPMHHAQAHSPCSLPARPIRLPEDLPAGRAGRRVPKYLIWIVLLTEEIVDLWLRINVSPCFQGGAGMRRRGDLRLAGRCGRGSGPGQSRRPVDGLPSKLCATRPYEEARSRMAEADIPF